MEVGNSQIIDEQNHQFCGVTAIFPRGRKNDHPVFAGFHSFNGNGEFTGAAWIEECGLLQYPVMLTNTDSVGKVRDGVIKWMINSSWGKNCSPWALPVVTETYDGELNGKRFVIKTKHVFEALDAASPERPILGSVGGGAGSISFDFKAGCGSSSRIVGKWVVGVWCQANIGIRRNLVIKGVPIGKSLPGDEVRSTSAGSLIVIIATNAPFMPVQLKRIAKRAALGMSRIGAAGHTGSGDFFLAFSTANEQMFTSEEEVLSGSFLPLVNASINPFFDAVIDATEEAILDAMVAQKPGPIKVPGYTVRSLPHDAVRQAFAVHNK